MNISTLHLFLALFLAALLPASAAQAVPPTTVAHSVFNETPRDPFAPVGFVKPKPTASGEKPEAKPLVDFKLKVTGISSMGTESSATLDNGQTVEPGGIYPYKSDDGKTTVTYKIVRITEDSVVALFDDKEYEFKLSNPTLDMFKEKDE